MAEFDNSAMRERIAMIVKRECGGSMSEMARQIDCVQPSVCNWVSGRTQINIAFIDAVLKRYTNISAEWLMRGEGDMYKKNSAINRTLQTINKFIPSCNSDTYYESLLDMRDQRIRELEREVARLRSGAQPEQIMRNA